MRQPDLFAPEPSAPERRPPDLPFVRKSLLAYLRLARNAEVLPWSEPKADWLTRHVPELAALLPPEEAEAVCAEFRAELARLRPDRAA